MISPTATKDSCYKLSIVHRRNNKNPEHTHTMYSDTYRESIDYLFSVYHTLDKIISVKIEVYE